MPNLSGIFLLLYQPDSGSRNSTKSEQMEPTSIRTLLFSPTGTTRRVTAAIAQGLGGPTRKTSPKRLHSEAESGKSSRTAIFGRSMCAVCTRPARRYGPCFGSSASCWPTSGGSAGIGTFPLRSPMRSDAPAAAAARRVARHRPSPPATKRIPIRRCACVAAPA